MLKRATTTRERSNTRIGRDSIRDSRSKSLHEIKEQDMHGSSSDNDDKQDYEKKLKSRIKAEKSISKIEKDKKMQKLNCCQKLYLWIRRNWVVDIIFRKSEEELDDIVV